MKNTYYKTLYNCRSDFYQTKRGKSRQTRFLKGFWKILEMKKAE